MLVCATGSTTTAETDDLLQLIDYIGNQKTANFVPSYALVSQTQMGRLLKATVAACYYAGNGSVIVSPNLIEALAKTRVLTNQ